MIGGLRRKPGRLTANANANHSSRSCDDSYGSLVLGQTAPADVGKTGLCGKGRERPAGRSFGSSRRKSIHGSLVGKA